MCRAHFDVGGIDGDGAHFDQHVVRKQFRRGQFEGEQFGFGRVFGHHAQDFFFVGIAPDGGVDAPKTVGIGFVTGDFAAAVVLFQQGVEFVGRQGKGVFAVNFDAVAALQKGAFGDVEKVDDAAAVEINVAVEQVVVEDVVVLLAGFAKQGDGLVFMAAEVKAAASDDFQPFERAQDQVCHVSLPRVFRRQLVRSGGKCSCRVRWNSRI